ncbi:MAG: ABC transporter substrate-binding protein [Betaproteobacteria bacterium]|nr:ABC transporter substrate-binding protein [Betaproteobacteria bacterium]
MISRRRSLIALGLGSFAVPITSLAQQPGKIARIGFLGSTSALGYARRLAAFRAGLRVLGYVEGKNIYIDFRWAEGRFDILRGLAVELVDLNVDVIVTYGTPGTRAAMQATKLIPIVMATSGDAVATGIVASLARPGGNVTGTTFLQPEITAKRLEMLKEVHPRARRIAVLVNPDNPATVPMLIAMDGTAKHFKVELQRFEARGPNEFEFAIAAMVTQRIEAFVLPEDPLFTSNAKIVADLVAKRRLSSIGFAGYAEAGGLMEYGPDLVEMNRRAAGFVDKILKGAKPADLPVEQPTKFEVAVNLKTAKSLGITIPQSLLIRADRLIE